MLQGEIVAMHVELLHGHAAKTMGKKPFFGATVAIKPEFHQHQEGRKQQQGGIEAQPSHDKRDELQQRVVRGEGAIEIKNVNLFFHIFFNLLGLSFVKGAPVWSISAAIMPQGQRVSAFPSQRLWGKQAAMVHTSNGFCASLPHGLRSRSGLQARSKGEMSRPTAAFNSQATGSVMPRHTQNLAQ